MLLLGDIVSSPFMAPGMPRRVRGARWGCREAPGLLPTLIPAGPPGRGRPQVRADSPHGHWRSCGWRGWSRRFRRGGRAEHQVVVVMLCDHEQVTHEMPGGGGWGGRGLRSPPLVTPLSRPPGPSLGPPGGLRLWPEITFSQPPVRNGGAGSGARWLREVECLSPFCCAARWPWMPAIVCHYN